MFHSCGKFVSSSTIVDTQRVSLMAQSMQYIKGSDDPTN